MSEKEKLNIDDRIFEVKFSCNLSRCKGACCTVYGTLGAPIKQSEITEIKNVIDNISEYLNENSKRIISDEGFYMEYEGKLYLNNVNERECVFCFHEERIAKCSFQEAYNRGRIGFKKPISCELFPVREYNNNGKELRYEKTYICEDALIKGKQLNITIFEFVKKAFIREYGKEFYNKFDKKVKN